MSISGIGGASGGSSYYSQIQQAGNSQFNQYVNNLKTLQQQDPDKFQSVMTDIAGQLQDAAQNASGDRAQALSDMASQYQDAAQTGDLSQIKPPRGGHHHHRGGAGGVQPNSASALLNGATTSTTDATGTTGTTGTSVQALFQSIFSEVSQAVQG